MNNKPYHKVKIHTVDSKIPFTKIEVDGEKLLATEYVLTQRPGYLPTLEVSMFPELDVDFEKCTMVLGNIEQIANIITESQMLSLIDRFNESGRYKKIEIVRDRNNETQEDQTITP